MERHFDEELKELKNQDENNKNVRKEVRTRFIPNAIHGRYAPLSLSSRRSASVLSTSNT